MFLWEIPANSERSQRPPSIQLAKTFFFLPLFPTGVKWNVGGVGWQCWLATSIPQKWTSNFSIESQFVFGCTHSPISAKKDIAKFRNKQHLKKTGWWAKVQVDIQHAFVPLISQKIDFLLPLRFGVPFACGISTKDSSVGKSMKNSRLNGWLFMVN